MNTLGEDKLDAPMGADGADQCHWKATFHSLPKVMAAGKGSRVLTESKYHCLQGR